MRAPKKDILWREFVTTEGARRARAEIAEDIDALRVNLAAACRKSTDPLVVALIARLDDLTSMATYLGQGERRDPESG